MDGTVGSKQVKCVVVTPERTVLEETAEFVAIPMYDGELGVLPGRAPLIGRLGAGELRFTKAGVSQRYYVDGGFAQVRGDVVTLLTQQAIPVSELSSAGIQAEMEALRQPAATPAAQAAKHVAAAKARIKLRLAGKA